ncbi:MAG: endo-1,4-beta-xylanase, partial [Lentisphaerae bacterium]|nr:endo-1,4-beta-xylanase [Lentisphaerota bacterium]
AMLVEGTDASVFVPADPVETGIYCEPPGNVFKEKENVVIKVSAVSYEADAVVKPHVSLMDYYNEKRFDSSVAFKLKAGIPQEKAVKIPLNRFGLFRAELRDKPEGPVIQERVVSRMRDYAAPSLRAESSVCGHWGVDEYQLAVGDRLGCPINRLHDGGSSVFLWKDLEPEKGKWNFDHADKCVELVRSHNMKMLGVLAAAPKWAAGEEAIEVYPGWLPGSKHLDDWENYVETVVKRYKGKVQYWEIWNEPPSIPVDFYVELCRRAYRAAKRAWPDVKLAPPNGHRAGQTWMRRLEAAGILDYCDIYSYHGYGTGYSGSLVIRSYAGADGKNRPVWDTESGTGGYSAEGFYQAMRMVQSAARETFKSASVSLRNQVEKIAAGTEKVFWYYNYAIPYNIGVKTSKSFLFFDYDGAMRPLGISWSLGGVMLAGYQPETAVNLGPARSAFLFSNGTDSMVLVWDRYLSSAVEELASFDPNWAPIELRSLLESLSGEEKRAQQMSLLNIALPKRVRILDVMTNPLKVAKKDGRTVIPLTPAPVYLHFPKTGASDVLALFAEAGVENIGRNDLWVRPLLGGDEEGNLKVRFKIMNDSHVEKDLKIVVSDIKGLKLGKNTKEKKLGRFESCVAGLPVSPDSAIGTEISGNYRIELGDGSPLTGDFMMSALTAKRFEKAPKIDGNLSDWNLDKRQSVFMDTSYLPETGKPGDWLRTAKEDISAEAWAGWDNDNFYIAVKVRDDKYIPAHQLPDWFWVDDCVEFFFDFDLFGDAEDEYMSGDDFQILSVAGTKDNPSKAVMTQGAFLGMKYTSKILEDGYVMEYSIPFEQMSPVKPEKGVSFGFDIAIDDADEFNKTGQPYRKLQMQWSTRAWNIWKTPFNYGIVILEP